MTDVDGVGTSLCGCRRLQDDTSELDAVEMLTDVQRAKERVAAAEAAAIRTARDQGRSWAEIAGALRVTKQAAWERWHAVTETACARDSA